MSLASQISHTVTALAATRDARREALGRIRTDAANHLSEARAAHRRMASAQQQHLTEALRSMKLGTAILLGAADERIDGYRKARVKQAARLDRELADGLKALRGDTRKWMSTQFAVRRKAAAEDLRQRRRDRKSLAASVHDLTVRNLAFLAGLTHDRQEASAIWLGRAASAPAAHSGATHAKAEATAKAESAVKAEAVIAEVIKAEPAKVEPVKPEPAKAEAAKPEAAKPEVAAKVEVKAESKPAAQKPAAEKSGSGKSA